jgi:ribosomal protein S18 acetylase RimI-like enzyme
VLVPPTAQGEAVVTEMRLAAADATMIFVPFRIRPYAPAGDRAWVEELWAAAMPAVWPVLRTGITAVGEGLVAEAGTGPVGFVAMDRAGSIPLILVEPGCQRAGIGTALLAEALDQIRAGGVTQASAGSGGVSYIWPGVPLDLPAAVAFFTALGWRHTHDVVDLVADLASYQPPLTARERSADIQVSLAHADCAEMASVLAFEAAMFPSWTRWFAAGDGQVLFARDSGGNIAGTLMLDGPGADTVFAPMLGPAASTIGCVGVAPYLHGHGIGTALVVRASQILSEAGSRACHIGWTTRESFYRNAGYQPWRRYVMFASPAAGNSRSG